MERASKPILYFEDAVGVSAGYRNLFHQLSRGQASPVSLYRIHSKRELLQWAGNRKAPGYRLDSESLQRVCRSVTQLLRANYPEIVVTSDPATLGLLMTRREESWNWATLDNLRGGVYSALGYTWVVTYPLTAYHTEVRERDIAVANDGFTEESLFQEHQERIQRDTQNVQHAESVEDEVDITGDAAEFESDKEAADSEDHFYSPIITKVNVGRFTLESDWEKTFRILKTQREHRAERQASKDVDL